MSLKGDKHRRELVSLENDAPQNGRAVEMLRQFEKGVDANFTGEHNSGVRGWLKIQIHNIIRELGCEPYAKHE